MARSPQRAISTPEARDPRFGEDAASPLRPEASYERQPLMMLWTGDAIGLPGSAPSSVMIGTRVAPNASNDS
jgi:hypothetical protein